MTKSGKTSSVVPSQTNSATANNTSKTETDNKSGTTKGNTSNEESDKTDSATTSSTNSAAEDNASKTKIDTESGTVNENTTEAESGKTDSINNAAEDNTGSFVSADENNQDGASQSENEQAEVNADNSSPENTYISPVEIDAVINTKGTLEITEATGSIIHVGSSIIISGSGFIGDIHDLELEIQSELRPLGVVGSSGDGSFEVQLSIPEDLEAGVHHIVVLYQGKEITRQEIEVGPKAADSFLQALTVGFTRDNKGLIPGLLILLGLFVSGAGVLGVNVFIRPRRSKG